MLPPGGLFDVVVCDGAPNVGGAWSSEAYSQAALILDACKLATEFLAPKGLFLTKARARRRAPIRPQRRCVQRETHARKAET